MNASPLHIIKLCVGASSIHEMVTHVARIRSARTRAGKVAQYVHKTRSFPRRAQEILRGGSLFWVIKGEVALRQPIVALNEGRFDDGSKCCEIVLQCQTFRTARLERRAFQGWRYLESCDAPDDVLLDDLGAELPAEIAMAAAEFGVRS